MKTRTTFYLGAALAACALVTFVAMYPSPAGAQEARFKGDFFGVGNATGGNCKWERKEGNSCNTLGVRCKFSAEIEDAPAVTFNVVVTRGGADQFTAGMVTGPGDDLNLDSDMGDAVPNLMVNDVCELREVGTDTLKAQATLALD